MNIRRLIVPLAVGVMIVHAGQSFAQGAFPAPLPNQGIIKNDPAFPPVNGSGSPFPPVNGAPAPSSNAFERGAAPVTGTAFERQPVAPSQMGGGPSEDCMKGFVPLREEAEKRGKLIKAAGDRHAPPDEACKLIGNFGQSEIKMINYIESHAAKCGIPPQVAEQLKNGHKGTENLQKRVCGVAQQVQQRGPAGPSLSEVLGSSATLPEVTAKKGGSMFDTLNGNVLAR